MSAEDQKKKQREANIAEIAQRYQEDPNADLSGYNILDIADATRTVSSVQKAKYEMDTLAIDEKCNKILSGVAQAKLMANEGKTDEAIDFLAQTYDTYYIDGVDFVRDESGKLAITKKDGKDYLTTKDLLGGEHLVEKNLPNFISLVNQNFPANNRQKQRESIVRGWAMPREYNRINAEDMNVWRNPAGEEIYQVEYVDFRGDGKKHKLFVDKAYNRLDPKDVTGGGFRSLADYKGTQEKPPSSSDKKYAKGETEKTLYNELYRNKLIDVDVDGRYLPLKKYSEADFKKANDILTKKGYRLVAQKKSGGWGDDYYQVSGIEPIKSEGGINPKGKKEDPLGIRELLKR